MGVRPLAASTRPRATTRRPAAARPVARPAAAARRVATQAAAADASSYLEDCPPKVGYLSKEERDELASKFGFRCVCSAWQAAGMPMHPVALRVLIQAVR